MRVFPARAGMNRQKRMRKVHICCVPRTRGDEPAKAYAKGAHLTVFPARAGMNRTRETNATASESVPRTRGDEP